jgi:hypothetical protein
MSKPILLVDFDGVIHSYTSGWQGASTISDPPVPGAIEFLQKASDVFNVQIYSSRSKEPGGVTAMKKYLAEHGGPAWIEFPTEKPPAFLTIDDRAICFTGEFPDPEELRAFKPWNKK